MGLVIGGSIGRFEVRREGTWPEISAVNTQLNFRLASESDTVGPR